MLDLKYITLILKSPRAQGFQLGRPQHWRTGVPPTQMQLKGKTHERLDLGLMRYSLVLWLRKILEQLSYRNGFD